MGAPPATGRAFFFFLRDMEWEKRKRRKVEGFEPCAALGRRNL
jgi:hypothetical protein